MHKLKFLADSDEDLFLPSQSSSWNICPNFPSQSSDADVALNWQSQSSDNPLFEHFSPPSSPPSSPSQYNSEFNFNHHFESSPSEIDDFVLQALQSTQSDDAENNEFENQDNDNIEQVINDMVENVGASKVAAAVLKNHDVRDEIASLLFKDSHVSLKTSLKKSKLTTSKQDRKYLLSLTPRSLCEELRSSSAFTFQVITQGLLGVSNPDDIFNSQHLLNCISLVYSTVAKTINRKATGYALLLTTVARDGGLREDSLKMCCQMVTPRTSQRYDKSVIATGWDNELQECLGKEKAYFENLNIAAAKVEQLLQDEEALEDVESAKHELEIMLDNAPPQLQLVWDNLNPRTKHRFERAGDKYSYSNLDWMASLWRPG